MPEVLFRRDPHTGKLQSNTHLHRWSDGSVTLAVGDEQYEIQSKPLAPAPGRPYQEVQDAHYYAAAAHLTTNSLVIIGHFTEQFSVRPNKDVIDEAVEKLKADLAGSQKNRANEMIITTNEDPELQMKQEELAEKERMRAQRRRETAAARIDGFGGGGGGGRYKGGALSIGDLETGRRGGPAGRKRGAPGGPKNKHRKPEYDSDDELPSGTRRQEEYDLDDGFLVDSDEESGGGDDGEEEEEMLDEDEDDRPAPRAKKRQRTFEPADGDADGEPDHVDARVQAAERSGNHRRRHVINDDDEED